MNGPYPYDRGDGLDTRFWELGRVCKIPTLWADQPRAAPRLVERPSADP